MQSLGFNAIGIGGESGDIMRRSFRMRTSVSGTRASRLGSCRSSHASSRSRRDALAERLDKQWCELRQHVTIEEDPEKMLRLTAEIDQRRRQSEDGDKRKDTF